MGKLISSGEGMVSGLFWMLLLLGGFLCGCLRKILKVSDSCFDLDVGQILTITDIQVHFSYVYYLNEETVFMKV